MIHSFTETVLTYKQSELEAWVNGDRTILPEFVPWDEMFENQPRNHFGEIYTLSHYSRIYDWKGIYAKYAIGLWEMNNAKLFAGRSKIEAMFSPHQLRKFRVEFVELIDTMNKGKGEPDLFLFKDNGETLFLEIKKQKDTVKQAQLDCLALIRSALKSEVGIVYLKEENQSYFPKTYHLDLVKYKGWEVK